MLPRKPSKNKGHAPPGDFIALGATKESKPSTSSLKGKRPAESLSGVKKESSLSVPSSSLLGAKKPKLAGQTFTPLGRPLDERGRASPSTHIYHYDEIAKEVDPNDLLDAIQDAELAGDDEKVEKLLCGAVKYLKMNRAKPNETMVLTLMYLAKTKNTIFGSEVVIEAFSSLLKRDVSLNFKSKGNPLVSVLACNILMEAFSEEKHWPDAFVKVYLEDALGERVWVDRQDCKLFVDNILTAFNTKIPPSSMLQSEVGKSDQTASAGTSPNPHIIGGEEEDKNLISQENFDKTMYDDEYSLIVEKRYTYQQVAIEQHVLDVIREQLNRRQTLDSVSRNLLRVMVVACGYSEIRVMATNRLEMWLQNPKLTRPAQDLLLSVCMNCNQYSQHDVDVMSQLSKIRLKTKPLVNHYLLCIRELLQQHPSNLRTLLTHTIYNELSQSRNPNNMSLLTVMFQFSSDHSARLMAEIFQDLLCNRDDYLRALRALLREIMRAVRQDMNFPEFALGLMQERTESKFRDMDSQLKERLLMSLADLISMTALLGITAPVREAAAAFGRGDARDLDVLRNFQSQVSIIQRDAVWWLHTVVPKMFDVKPPEYIHYLRKVLFVEKSEHYHKLDNWPGEGERATMLRLVSEVPVQEDTLMRVMIIGLTRELGVNAADALELADQLIRRAAMLSNEGFDVLQVERLKLFDAMFNLSAYRHPENIALPKGYTPPSLAISNLYWKSWIMLLIISAFNPAVFGLAAWDKYPMLKCFMEMVMTKNYQWPPATMASDEKAVEELRNHERQTSELEKQAILEFEGYLAAATTKKTITVETSLLIPQLTTMDPTGIARRPPSAVIEQIKGLNQALQLGSMLCRSRKPDFLLSIIERQGTSQSMAWLADLVDSSEGSLEVLPVQCLCEFLLHDEPDMYGADDDKFVKKKIHKQEQLLGRLQSLVHGKGSSSQHVIEVLNYFLQRLASQQTATRQLAKKGLSMVLAKSHLDSDSEEEQPMEVEESHAVKVLPQHRWLLEQLPALSQFSSAKKEACAILRQACQVETDAGTISAYIVFLSQHTSDLQLQELDELVLDIATLIVERATLINHLLPSEASTSERADLVLSAMVDLFYNYLLKAQQDQDQGYVWSNTQDQILLQWESGTSATVNVLVVHAMIILLTYGAPKGNGASNYEKLLNSWFPEGGRPPTAFLVDTSEEALLLPDWLKLRMIRSTSLRLVEAALQDLEPGQLLLFVQSFGIPVQSMSKLLQCLDTAVEDDPEGMENSVVDKGYMAQLIEVQHMRGASGGKKFHALLKAGSEPQPPEVEDVEMLSPVRRHRLQSQLSRAPELLPPQADAKQVLELLSKIFMSKDTLASDRQLMHRSLVKMIAKDPNICTPTVKALNKLMSSHKGNLVNALLTHHILACSLIRILMSKIKKHNSEMVTFVKKVKEHIKEKETGSLSQLMTQYLNKHTSVTTRQVIQDKLEYLNKKGGKSAAQALTYGLGTEDGQEELERYEEGVANTCIYRSILGGSTKQITQTVTKLLEQSLKRGELNSSTQRLLVDWLEILDPEMISSNPTVEQSLLFGNLENKRSKEGGKSPKAKVVAEEDKSKVKGKRKSLQSYLLALLTHHTSWTSLHNCISLLLQENSLARFNSTSALDFLWACVHLPKIWQGRDKKPPKNYKPEDVLQLSTEQIQVLVDYIIDEASGYPSNQYNTIVDVRMSLLLRACSQKKHLLRTVTKHLYERLKLNRDDRKVVKHVLMQLYLRVPHSLCLIERDPAYQLTSVSQSREGTCQLDSISHTLLTSLGNTGPNKQSEDRMLDANIACRKLAIEHPLLLLRQMPLVAAMLQGRCNYTFGEFRHRNHHLLFTHVMGLFELLQPHIYHKDYQEAFQLCLDSFFELLKRHCLDNKQLASIVTKFIGFLSTFMSHDAVKASKMLHQYLPTLKNLNLQYPDFATLKSLLAGLNLPHGQSIRSRESRSPTPEEDGTTLLELQRPSSPPLPAAQLMPFRKRIGKGASLEDTLEVLKEIDDASKRKVDIIQPFLNDLKRLMSHNNDTARNTSHTLIMRYVRHCPKSAHEFVSVFKHCLDSSNLDIVNSTLHNLAEFCLLAQEHAVELLLKAFRVGVHSKVESASYINDAMQLLNLETMQQ